MKKITIVSMSLFLTAANAFAASPATLTCEVKYTLETPEQRAKNEQGDLTMPNYHTLALGPKSPGIGVSTSLANEDALLSAGASILTSTPNKLNFRVTLKKLKATGAPLVLSGSYPVPRGATAEVNLAPNARDESDNGILSVTLSCKSN